MPEPTYWIYREVHDHSFRYLVRKEEGKLTGVVYFSGVVRVPPSGYPFLTDQEDLDKFGYIQTEVEGPYTEPAE